MTYFLVKWTNPIGRDSSQIIMAQDMETARIVVRLAYPSALGIRAMELLV